MSGLIGGILGLWMFLSMINAASAETMMGRLDHAQLFRLNFGVSGEVAQVHVSVGDRVGKGMLLANLHGAPFQADLEASEAEVRWKRSELDEAVRKLERDEELFDEGSLSLVEFDLVHIAQQKAESEYRRSVAKHAFSQQNAEFGKIMAPADGLVISVGAYEGERINTDNPSGRPALIIGSAELVVRALAFPGSAMPGVGDTVNLMINDQRSSGRVQSILPASGGENLEVTVEAGTDLTPVGDIVEIRF